jgi:L-ribulose-5-phosphate 3-epimerase
MILDKLGVLTDEVSENFTEALDWIREQGLRHVEIRVVNGKNAVELGDEEIRIVRDEVQARGLFVSALASPLFKCALNPARPVASGDTFGQKEAGIEEHFAMLERAIAIAKLLGTRRIRIFSFWREREPAYYFGEIVRLLKRAAVIAEREDVLLLLENEPSCNAGFADETAACILAVNSPFVRGLWDPGNEEYGGRQAFPSGYGQMKDVLSHVHLKDACRTEDGKSRCVPLGSGRVAVIEQLKALLVDGYDGLFTIETHFIPKGGTQLTGTRLSLEALRVLLEELKPIREGKR